MAEIAAEQKTDTTKNGMKFDIKKHWVLVLLGIGTAYAVYKGFTAK